MSTRLAPCRSLAALAFVAASLASLGCYQIVDDEDAGSGAKDGGTVDLSDASVQPGVDSGPNPNLDAGPGPNPDAGPGPGVDAGPPDVQILSFTADSETLAFLSGTTLRYNTANAQSCAIAPDIGAVQLPSGSRYVEAGTPGDSVTYTLTCQGNGGPVSASVTVVTTLVEHPGNYTATTAAELSSLANINVIGGDLTLQGLAGVTDLAVLEGLVRVGGNLFVLSNPALTTVNLPYLEEIGRALFVDSNPSLSAFALPALTGVGERLYVSRNPSVTQASIDGLVSQLSAAEGIGGPVMDFYNDPVDVIGVLDQIMVCSTNGSTPSYELDFRPNGEVVAFDFTQSAFYYGSYARFEQQLEIEFPGVTGRLTATATELEYDRVTRAVFASEPGACFLTGLPGTGVLATQLYRCPTGGGAERMEVELRPDGTAWWTNAPTSGSGETLTFPGAYVVEGQWVYFAFPEGIRPSTPNLRFPIARLVGGSLDFPELPAANTPCPLD